jgi:hypothetical protein
MRILVNFNIIIYYQIFKKFKIELRKEVDIQYMLVEKILDEK